MKREMKNIRNNVITKMVLIVLIMIFLGYIAKMATYILPSEPMKANMKKCVEIFVNEGRYPLLNEGYKSTRLDNYTDAIMISTALYDDEQKNVFEKIAGNYRITYEGKNPVDCLVSHLEENCIGVSEAEYARYWHGYLVILKPILLFFDYSDIRIFNMIVQSFLLLYLLSLLYRNEQLREYVVPLMASILVLNPHTISYSMQYSWVYYIILISSILVVSKKDYFLAIPSKLLLFFTLIGTLTSFFDLLTWPLATCGIPLVFVLITEKGESWLKKLICIVKCTVSWGIGYFGMWFGCWAIGTISLKKNIFKDAIEQVIFRTSNNISPDEVNLVTTKEVFRNQFFPILKWPYAILLLVVLLVCLYNLVVEMRKNRLVPRTVLFEMLPFLLICTMPFVWFAVTRNHSFLHYTYTWRTLIITIFSGLAMMIKLKECLTNREI